MKIDEQAQHIARSTSQDSGFNEKVEKNEKTGNEVPSRLRNSGKSLNNLNLSSTPVRHFMSRSSSWIQK